MRRISGLGSMIPITQIAGKIRESQKTNKKIHPNSKTIELGCGKILSFRQILHITSSS